MGGYTLGAVEQPPGVAFSDQSECLGVVIPSRPRRERLAKLGAAGAVPGPRVVDAALGDVPGDPARAMG